MRSALLRGAPSAFGAAAAFRPRMLSGTAGSRTLLGLLVERSPQITPDLPLKGPAVIEEAYTTVLLADGWNCRRDKSGHLIAERVQP